MKKWKVLDLRSPYPFNNIIPLSIYSLVGIISMKWEIE